jgi:SSS family solute:Na+ symporter
MDLITLSLSGIALYALLMIVISWIKSSKNNNDFIIGGRNVGILGTAASIGAGWRDSAFMIFWLTFSYTTGWAVYSVFIGSITSLLLFSYFAARIRDEAKDKGYIAPGQMIRDYIGPFCKNIYTLLFLFISTMFCAAQLFVLSTLLSGILSITPLFTVICIACVVLFYLWRGGYGNVIITDIVQSIIVLSLIALPFFIDADPKDIYDWSSFGNLGWAETIALWLFPFVWNMSSPDLWQKVYSAKNSKTVRIALPLGAVYAAFLTFGLVYLGIALRSYLPGAEPNQLFTLIFEKEVFPSYVLSGMLVIFFAMGMSTFDTYSYVFSSIVMRNLIKTSARENSESYVKQTRLVTLIFISGVSLLALGFDNLVSILMGLISSYAVASAMFYVILFKALSASRVNDFVLGGITVLAFGLYLYMHITDMFGTSFVLSIIPAGLSCLLTLLWTLFSRWKFGKPQSAKMAT